MILVIPAENVGILFKSRLQGYMLPGCIHFGKTELASKFGNNLVKTLKYSKIFLYYSLFSCLGKMSVFTRKFIKKDTFPVFEHRVQYRTFEFIIKRSIDESVESLENSNR